MIFRTVSVMLTILGLLACPVHCTAGRCVAADVVSSGSGCSGCSPNCPSNNEKGDHSQPEPEESGQNCHMGACRGFLRQSPRRPVVDCRLLLACASVTPAAGAAEVDAVAEPPARNGLEPVVGCAPAGRAILIAICSLLL